MTKKIKAVLFDMDGVLIDAKEWHYEALNRALGLFGHEISRYDHLVTYDGLPTRRKLEMLSLERGLPRALHEFVSRMKQQYTMDLVYSRCKPKFIHEYALSRLKLDGYKIAVCSNSVRHSVETMVDRARLAPYVDLLLSNEDVSKAKPHPEIYLKTFEKFSVSPDECLILEDNTNGVKAALDSGAHLLQVTNVDDVTYDLVVSRIHEIEYNTHSRMAAEFVVLEEESQSTAPTGGSGIIPRKARIANNARVR